MHRKLLEILVDPATGEGLTLAEDDGSEVIDHGLLLSPSGNRFPVLRGVPRFVPSENYSESFGLQWNRFARVQMDSASGTSYSKQRFDAEVGWSDDIRGRWVLDAGCGSGRFAEIAASYGAEVLAVDLSSAVDAAMANLGHLPNVHVVQADLRALPFRREAVRHAYSIGVLQHTPDPVASTRALVDALPPGARFSLTIYGRKTWTRLYSKYWLRPLTRRMRPELLLKTVERSMRILFPLTSVLFRVPLLGRLFRFVLPVANYVEKSDVSRRLRFEEAILDTFDMLAPAFDRPVTADEVRKGLSGSVQALHFRRTVPVVVHGVRS